MKTQNETIHYKVLTNYEIRPRLKKRAKRYFHKLQRREGKRKILKDVSMLKEEILLSEKEISLSE